MKRALLAMVLLLSGCVYYNGVYNAKRLARAAERAERDGRTIEARDYWGQVVVKADSVVARHPASGYVPEVQLLRGRALARMGQCVEAVPALEQSVAISTDSAAIEAGLFELARCQALAGNMSGSADAFGRLVGAHDPQRRQEARYEYANALVLAGRYDEALVAIDSLGDDPRAAAERMVATGGAGHLADAFALADSGLARADTTLPWDSLLAAAGRRDPVAVSGFVDRLVAMPAATPAMRSRWLLGDGVRLFGVDSARADARLAQAASGDATEAGATARLRRIQVALARSRDASDLALAVDSLEAIKLLPTVSVEAERILPAVVRVRAAADSAELKPPQGDLALFLAAELARDVLDAPALATTLLQRLVTAWPDSPYAPKAMLAMHRLGPGTGGDTLRTLLETRYAGNPYVAALRGEDPPGLRALEDSLGAFAAARALTGGEPVQPVQPGARPNTTRPDAGSRRPTDAF